MLSIMWLVLVFFFFQAEDGIRDLVRSRGLGDVYKRQVLNGPINPPISGTTCFFGRSVSKILVDPTNAATIFVSTGTGVIGNPNGSPGGGTCLLYTSDAADDLLCVDLGGRRIIKNKKKKKNNTNEI